ncbi:Alcohol oxidase [Colletotrichum sp. SAR11_57]|nr:Alcohol oxidase [Colletotrichum sp. SAR11_57]
MGRMSISKAIIATLATVRVAMSVYTELPSDLTEVDIIIAGGGTAGSIIASRLAEADASTTILVIEQGGDSYNVTNVIYPALFERNTLPGGEYPNLHVLVETQVLRVLFDDAKRATGVEFRPNPNFAKAGQDNNHHFVGYVYRTSLNQNETINGIARNDRGRDVPAMIAADDPQLGWNGHDASSKLRPSPADIAALGPEFQEVWDRDFKDSPNRPLMIWGLFNAFFGDPSILPDDAEYVTTAPWVTYPYARGHVHITGPTIGDDYDFDPGWLLDENDIDLKSHIWGYKTQRKMARQMDVFRGELASGQPKFPEGSQAAVIEVADGPIGEEIEYSAEDEAAIVQYIRENIGTSRHPLGTCKMAPREATGVVDANLNVYGVSGLKIADLSVPPHQVAANTYNTALMLGEKAADMIIQELGLA